LKIRYLLITLLASSLSADIPANWNVEPEDYEDVFTVTAQLSVHDTINHDSSKTIAAFIGDECRGVNSFIPVGDDWLVFLMVYGNAGDSEIQFKYHDGVLDSVFNIEETLVFYPSGSEGTPDFPYVFHGEGINIAPVADAGLDIVVGEQEWVTLDGTGSYDLDNDELTFLWSTPEEIDLDDVTSPTPSFITPDVDDSTHYQIILSVFDGVNNSSPDTIVVTVLNTLAISIETYPFEFKLYNPYPNPFNPVTTIMYDLPEYSQVTVNIYNVVGQLVSSPVNGDISAGYRVLQWDGTDNNGNSISSGIYLYIITAKSQESGKLFTDKKKMILIK